VTDRQLAQRLRKIELDFGDVAMFCRESLTVRNKRGYAVPLEPGPAQLRLFDRIKGAREARKPGRFIYLKARQVWVSTAFEAELFHVLPFQSGQRAKVLAHDKDSAMNIAGYFKQFLTGYKPFRGVLGIPPLIQNVADHLIFANSSELMINTAGTTTTGRSFSLRFLHLSELAFWANAKVLMDGAMQAVPDDPDTCVLIESTANGAGGYFYELWKDAVDPTSGSPWIPIFFAWWEHPEYTREIEGDPRAFRDSLDAEERGLMEKYGCTLGQLAWRRWKIREGCSGSFATFHQEFPSSPEEAFLASGRPRFSIVHIGRMPEEPPAFRGELEQVRTPTGLRVERVPHDQGSITIWRNPRRNSRYAAGVDLAEGIDRNAIAGRPVIGKENPDFSCLQILDIDSGEQAAMVRGRIQPGAFAEITMLIAELYGWPYLVPEANGPGLAYLEVLQRLGYPMGRVYHRLPDPSQIYSTESQHLLDLLGWKTTTVTRPQLISKLDQAIRELAIFVHCPITLAELRSFVIKANGKCEAQDGDHDDTVFAIALAVVGIETAPPDRRLANVPRDELSRKKPARTMTDYGNKPRIEERGMRIRL
jgi:hypothetical protein